MAVIKKLTCAGIIAGGMFLLPAMSCAADQPIMMSPVPTVSTLPTVPLTESGLKIQATGSEFGSWDSNPIMLITGARSLYGSTTSPELTITDSSPTTQASVDTLINENVFNQSDFNSTDVHSTINLATQNQRWMAEVQEKTDYDTTRTSELSAYGISTTPVRHIGESLAPQISFSPTAIDKFSILSDLQVSHYEKSVYSNYELASITPTYAHNFDPRNAGTFSFQAQTYKTTDGISNTIDSFGPSVGWVTTLTPRLTARANIGAQASRQFEEGFASQPWVVDYIYSLDIGFQGQQDITDLIANRSEFPFGNGTEALLTTVSLSETHALNPQISLNTSLSYQSGQYQTDTVGSLQSLWSGSAGLTYHLTEHLDAAATYQYRYETLTSTSGNAQDNIATVGIIYHPKAWAL